MCEACHAGTFGTPQCAGCPEPAFEHLVVETGGHNGEDGHGPKVAWTFLTTLDDDGNFVHSAVTQGGLGWGNLRAMWTETLIRVWEPASWLIRAAIVAGFGLSPIAVRRVTLAFHAASACLVFATTHALLLRWFMNRRGASARRQQAARSLALPRHAHNHITACSLAATLLYAVHPIHAEVVGWPSAGSYAPAATFMHLALWLAVKDDPGPTATPVPVCRRLGVLVAYTVAVMCKSVAVLLPVAIVAVEWAFVPQQQQQEQQQQQQHQQQHQQRRRLQLPPHASPCGHAHVHDSSNSTDNVHDDSNCNSNSTTDHDNDNSNDNDNDNDNVRDNNNDRGNGSDSNRHLPTPHPPTPTPHHGWWTFLHAVAASVARHWPLFVLMALLVVPITRANAGDAQQRSIVDTVNLSPPQRAAKSVVTPWLTLARVVAPVGLRPHTPIHARDLALFGGGADAGPSVVVARAFAQAHGGSGGGGGGGGGGASGASSGVDAGSGVGVDGCNGATPVAVALTALVAGVALSSWWRRPYVLSACGYFFIMMMPVRRVLWGAHVYVCVCVCVVWYMGMWVDS